jgi:hypothetical protein
MPLAGLPHGRVDQIASVVPDLEAAMDGHIAALGVTFSVFEVDETNSTCSGSSKKFRIRIAVALAGLLTIELIQPVSGVTLYSKHLDSRGSGLHHLGVHVPDLGKAKRALTRRGNPLLLDGAIDGLGKFAYFEVAEMHCILEVLQLSLSLPLFLLEHAEVYSGKR